MERDDPSADAADADDATEDGEEEFESDVERAERAERAERVEMDEAHEGERRGSVAGGTDRRLPVEPESVNLENALFVLLGIVVTLAVFAQFVVG